MCVCACVCVRVCARAGVIQPWIILRFLHHTFLADVVYYIHYSSSSAWIIYKKQPSAKKSHRNQPCVSVDLVPFLYFWNPNHRRPFSNKNVPSSDIASFEASFGLHEHIIQRRCLLGRRQKTCMTSKMWWWL